MPRRSSAASPSRQACDRQKPSSEMRSYGRRLALLSTFFRSHSAVFCRNAEGCETRHAGASSIVLWNCPLLIRQRATTSLDCTRVPMGGRDQPPDSLCMGNSSPFHAEIFLNPFRRSAPDKMAPADGGALGPSCLLRRQNGGRRDHSPIRPACAGSVMVVRIDHLQLFSTACALYRAEPATGLPLDAVSQNFL